jgi:glycosyltransferase involved in cell wall biosynthesis
MIRMPEKRKSICIISFSPIASDARVLRQIEYLSPHYDVTIIGEGEAYSAWKQMPSVKWVPTLQINPETSLRRLLQRTSGISMLLAGRLHPVAFYHWYWRQLIMKDTLSKAVASGADAFHANDWNALPIAVEAARQVGGARVVFDAHEYAPLEFENRFIWRLAYSSMIKYMLHRYAPEVDVSMTVAPAIAERYRREFQMETIVVLNAPSARELPPAREKRADVRLIHHGAAIPDRRLEVMIEALARCQSRYTLHFMLTGADSGYANHLKKLSHELTPGRVFFHDPVPPSDVVRRISEFDLGFCYIAPTNYNYFVSLPNKFFDFIAAGLPVCIGPSPSMAEIVRSYGLGCVATSFEPQAVAAMLNELTPEQYFKMQEGARRAAAEINAEREMGKLVEVYQRLLRVSAQ